MASSKTNTAGADARSKPITRKRSSRPSTTRKRRRAGDASAKPARRRVARPAPEAPRVPLADVAPVLHRRAAFKHGFVRAVLAKADEMSVADAVAMHAAVTGLEPHDIPSRRTVVDWVAKAKAHGINGLVDAPRQDRGHRRALDPLLEKVRARVDIDDLIRTVVVGGKAGASMVYRLLNRRLRRYDLTVAFSTVARWVAEWKRRNAHLVHRAHQGAGAFADDATLHLGWDDVAPLRLWSFDSTPADEWIRMRDPSNPRLILPERPNVSRLIDVGSRALITFEVTIGPVTADHVLGLIRRAVVPGENWEGLPTVPPPASVRVDGGGEHRGVVATALLSLGVTLDVARSPDAKPERQTFVERLHGTLNRWTSADAVGRTTAARVWPDDDSARDAMRGRNHRAREVRRPPVNLEVLRSCPEFLEQCRRVSVAYNDRRQKGLLRAERARARVMDAVA
jgi:hypothetical protein